MLSEAYWDVTHRPLQCLVFLLPMVIAYELGMGFFYRNTPVEMRPSLAAEELMNWFFSLFGGTGAYLPGAVLVAVLLVWHIATRNPWRVPGQPLLGMAGESVLLAIPLLFLHGRLTNLHALFDTGHGTGGGSSPWQEDLLLSIGAGIYEELVFRLIIIGLLNLLLIDICGMKQIAGVAAAVIASSLLFALHHYPPIGSDSSWSASEFAFRTAAGAYLAAVFVLRGFGLAVGCHTMYDVLAFLLSR
ncbi:MAG: CPBP family intramembrane metalloprotease [Planctomycetes bacterium]|nr:CPBP family intramembrane metalloprotease [Planctomycetota bacterium]